MAKKPKPAPAKPSGRMVRRNVMLSEATIERLEAIRARHELDSFSAAIRWAARIAAERGEEP